jgi:hypothetical protein
MSNETETKSEADIALTLLESKLLQLPVLEQMEVIECRQKILELIKKFESSAKLATLYVSLEIGISEGR